MSEKKMFYFLLFTMVALLLSACAGSAAAEEAEDPYATIPEQLTSELQVQVAYNDTDIVWRLSWEAENPGIYHDYLVYTDGEWKRQGDSGGGSDSLGLREDRVLIMLDPGTVSGFANQGCYVGCHDGMVSLDNEVGEDEISTAGTYWPDDSEVSKYILDSRNGADWWDGKWSAVKTEDEVAALQEAGVFLDLWHWRAHRSHPLGYSDNQYVLEGRNSDGTRSSFKTNFVSDTGLPEFMYDPVKTGFVALKFDDLINGRLSQDDYYYLSTENAVEFDPDYNWQNGDAIPRRLLREPEGSQASIMSAGKWENGRWTVELMRSLSVDTPTVSHPLVVGRTYNAAFAVHINATGARWHYISQTQRVGIGTPADISAVSFTGDAPNWQTIPTVLVPLFYPGQVTWDWLVSDAHPGAAEIRADSRSCASCHGDSQDAVLKIAQASIYHETSGFSRSTNWFLTLTAVVVFFSGVNFSMIKLYQNKTRK